MSTPEIHALLPAETSEPMSTSSPTSPFDIPEIASLIASYISEDSDLARCARVSHALHDVCIPILWKSVHISDLTDLWDSGPDEDLHVGRFPFGYFSLIEELTFTYKVCADDVKAVAENCTGLKVLNFDGAQVTAQSLAILIPSDPNQTRDSDPGDGSKRRKTRSPSSLESLSFKNCWKLAGPTCLKTVSLLGPQLKRLSLSGCKDITDQDMIRLVRRCPNLVGLRLKKTSISDEFLKSFAQEFPPSGSTSTPGRHRQYLESLNLNSTKVSTEGIIPVVMACRCTLKTLSAQYVKSVNDNVLFALVKGFINENVAEGPKVAPYFNTPANDPKHAHDKTPITHHRFALNTVLTEIRLSQSSGLTNVGFQALFQFATELVSIKLDACAVRDGALMVLAETYRNRMKAFGLGVPAAWREHELADERVQAMTQKEEAAECHRATSTAATSAIKSSMGRNDTGVKVFTNGHVPGGLRKLYLCDTREITNKGVRAILRSCVGLELLHIEATPVVTLELFHGPWACPRLKDLYMSNMALETTLEDLKALEDGPYGYEAERKAHYQEEVVDSLRFPLAIDPYPGEDDFDEDGSYEHMAMPLVEYDYDGNEVRRNTSRQRAILREFYSKLGQLNQLRTLNMNHCHFRFRVKDGLELVLPGLQQNLIKWKVDLENGYQMGNSEQEFFSKHFGYGYSHDFTVEKDYGQDQLEVKTRKAPLQDLVLYGAAFRYARRKMIDWAGRQGFNIVLDNRELGRE